MFWFFFFQSGVATTVAPNLSVISDKHHAPFAEKDHIRLFVCLGNSVPSRQTQEDSLFKDQKHRGSIGLRDPKSAMFAASVIVSVTMTFCGASRRLGVLCAVCYRTSS